jgi:capsular exopolysaccharide synthesis family protein
LGSVQTGNAEVVQPADLPTSPSSPQTTRNAIVGGLLGLLIGGALAVAFQRMRRRIRAQEKASAAYDLPVLGTIPNSKAISKANKVSGPVTLPFAESEAFRTVRAALRYFDVSRAIRSVVITSDAVGEGKSTVAWNLALASSSSKVMLLEADMRDPSLARQHGLDPEPGLSEILTDRISWPEATQSIYVNGEGSSPTGEEQTLDVIVAGRVPSNPAELIEKEQMGHLLAALKGYYDLVVIDTAPTGVVSDAFPLLREVDGVIVVARAGRTTRESAQRARDRLGRLDAKVLGIVPNAVKEKRRNANGYQVQRSDDAPPVSAGSS